MLPPKPTIQIDRISITCDRAIAVLADRALIFQRNAGLYEIVSYLPLPEDGGGHDFRFRKLNQHTLQRILMRVADWEEFDERRLNWIPKKLPLEICRTILSRQGEWPFPWIKGANPILLNGERLR
jgi:hypothetical protein